ncbi:uncharacterized protein PB18E9.04c-like [Haliotis rufescens]|uniref:uncharacterized protein PB18E9.04c-like n=1 Tax=Haliotis rufescens TaxID=6454 RepID=UPI00201F2057|nr:uncharacterized protein PB18E9.04c-like [Haliotis rufescens]
MLPLVLDARPDIMLLDNVALVAAVIGTVLTQGHASDNIALGKATTQSSTWRNFVPGLGVDGNTGQHLFRDNCTHTLDTGEFQPWWRVDLGADYAVDSVRITNRVDCCAQRLANFNVSVGQNAGSLVHYQLCYFHNGHYGTTTKSIVCDSRPVGRYLKIQLTEFERLTLCEVAVYGALASYANSPSSEPLSSTLSSSLLMSSYTTSPTTYDQAVRSHVSSATSEILQTDPLADTDVPTTDLYIDSPTSTFSSAPLTSSYSTSTTTHDQAVSSHVSSATSEILQTDPLADTEVPTTGIKTSFLHHDSPSITDTLDDTETSIQPSFASTHYTTSPITPQLLDMMSQARDDTTNIELSTFENSHFQTGHPTASVTASTPGSSVVAERFCLCRCKILFPHTSALLEELDVEIKKRLLLSATNTSSYIRSKRSAKNVKPSEQYIGLFGMFLISFVSALVVLPDVVGLFRFLCGRQGRN